MGIFRLFRVKKDPMNNLDVQYEIPPTEEELPIGTMLSDGKFTITGSLGFGGFGITYRATDNVLGRAIVIKECFSEEFCARDGALVVARSAAYTQQCRSIVEMFMREARSLAQLRHPNIVGVHSAFEENGTAYMALDLIDGPDLLDILETQSVSFSPARVKDIVLQLLGAIAEVHALDLLHRDIAPDNIIIDKSGAPILIDFGAARGDASRKTRAKSSLLVVKDGYSPQEFYIPGSVQKPCSDLYAFGATLYHLLSGEPPVSSQARMLEISGSKPDPCRPLEGRIEGYDAKFLQAIDMAMRVHPSKRLQSAGDWKKMISEVVQLAKLPPKPNTPPPIPESTPPVDFTLNHLIEETNEVVRKSRSVKVEPVVEKVSEAVSSRPEWVDEFNQETFDLNELVPKSPENTVGLEGKLAAIGNPTQTLEEPMVEMATSAGVADRPSEDALNAADHITGTSTKAQKTNGIEMSALANDPASKYDPRWGRDMSRATLGRLLCLYLLAGFAIGAFLILCMALF